MRKHLSGGPAVAVAVALALALYPVAGAHAFSAATGSVSGHVRSANTGDSLRDVTVRVFDMNSAELIVEARTDEEGALTLPELPYGLYQIVVVAPEGYAAAAGPLVHLTADNPEATVTFNLEALPNAPAPSQFGGFPLWAIFLAIASAAAITAAALAIGNGEPQVPVGTQ